jgi:hypothetical protein
MLLDCGRTSSRTMRWAYWHGIPPLQLRHSHFRFRSTLFKIPKQLASSIYSFTYTFSTVHSSHAVRKILPIHS